MKDQVWRKVKHLRKEICLGAFAATSSAMVTSSCCMYSSSAAFTCLDLSGLSYMKTQSPIQMKPRAPMMMKAISQPPPIPLSLKNWARRGMVAGATRAPTDAPALKIEVAKARSFLGKYSAVVLMAAGKLPASPRASMQRAAMKSHTLMLAIARAAAEPASTAAISLTDAYPSMCIVAQPQAAWRQAPADHTPIAQR